MQASFDGTPDSQLRTVAAQYAQHFAVGASERYEIEELLWSEESGPRIPRKQRHDLAKALDPRDLYCDAGRFDQLLERLFLVEDDVFGAMRSLLGPPDQSLKAEIARHVHCFKGDWSPFELFERLGAFDCSDRRFRLFVEGLVGPEVRPDEESQRAWATTLNHHLRTCGAELRETNSDGGYPVFTIVSRSPGETGRPKNVIFAALEKPDLRLRDSVNNDIEIVSDPNQVLIYDRPISGDGLSWAALQDWWADRERVPNNNEAKSSLYRRLLRCLPASPPQTLLFETFFKTFKRSIPSLPALLPEVYLHWDHQTVADRGAEALFRQRMDFLLLLPHGVRVVIEVDGKHHYTDRFDRPSPSRYAQMTSADRDLRLAGYDVFRFGGAELDGESGQRLVAEFFVRMLKRHGIDMNP